MLSRNDYIMALTSVNAYKTRLFSSELQNIVDALDQNFHDSLRQSFALFYQANLQTGLFISRYSACLIYLDTNSIAVGEKISNCTNAIDASVEKVRVLSHLGVNIQAKFFAEFQHAFHSQYRFDLLRYPGDKVCARGRSSLSTTGGNHPFYTGYDFAASGALFRPRILG
jgi:hypothetical protein